MSNSELSIRLANAEDVNTIQPFIRQAYAKWVPVLGREPTPMSVDYEQAVKAHRFDLLYQKNDLVALLETNNKKDCLFIENLCVSPDKQREGLGQYLLNYAEVVAQKAGHKTLRLDTNSLFSGNVKLYRRMGYVIDWEKPNDVGMHVHMVKTLSN